MHTCRPARPIDVEEVEAREWEAARRAQEVLLRQLVETGEKDRLLAALRERLQEAGWQEQVKEHSKGRSVSYHPSVRPIRPCAREWGILMARVRLADLARADFEWRECQPPSLPQACCRARGWTG